MSIEYYIGTEKVSKEVFDTVQMYKKDNSLLTCENEKYKKAVKIIRDKQVNMRAFVVSALLNEHKTPDAYNFTVSADKNTALIQEEWDLLKEVFKL